MIVWISRCSIVHSSLRMFVVNDFSNLGFPDVFFWNPSPFKRSHFNTFYQDHQRFLCPITARSGTHPRNPFYKRKSSQPQTMPAGGNTSRNDKAVNESMMFQPPERYENRLHLTAYCRQQLPTIECIFTTWGLSTYLCLEDLSLSRERSSRDWWTPLLFVRLVVTLIIAQLAGTQ